MGGRKRLGVLWRLALALALLLTALFFLLQGNLSQAILNMAHARASAIAVSFMNAAVQDMMRSGVTYEELISVKTDEHGVVRMLQANTVRMNELAMETALRAQENLAGAEAQTISVPLGAALSVPFLSGLGPDITVRTLPVGAVSATFNTEFESAGINQTRHKIYLSMQTSVRLVVPANAKLVSVTSQVLIAESIIVGEVPQSYIEVPNVTDTLNFTP